jgi:hypothetical protein
MGFLNEIAPSASDLLNAVSDFPNTRLASGITNRDNQVMTWMLPNGTTVQMYINPENLSIQESKQINSTRTKGGFIVQYWGDNLTKLTLTGSTGSSGIRGINVLRDIYHSENRIFEVVAGSQTGRIIDNIEAGATADAGVGYSLVSYVSQQLRDMNFILRPSLASLALGITLFYQGVEYRVFFNSFNTVEEVNLFRGKRKNFMAWHREPVADDPAGQLLNALVSKAGNALRGFMGLGAQQNTPETFHPESAPLTFGGNSVASQFGLEATGGNKAAGQRR